VYRVGVLFSGHLGGLTPLHGPRRVTAGLKECADLRYGRRTRDTTGECSPVEDEPRIGLDGKAAPNRFKDFWR
jgi:hypothetical protein